jgi:hypothetical protein
MITRGKVLAASGVICFLLAFVLPVRFVTGTRDWNTPLSEDQFIAVCLFLGVGVAFLWGAAILERQPAPAIEEYVDRQSASQSGKESPSASGSAEASGSSGNDEAYLSRCLTRQYTEEPESRAWNSDPAFRAVLDPLNNGDNLKACRAAEALAATHGDLALVYRWWGKALLNMREFDRARKLVTGALARTKQKFVLCNLLGEIEWKARRIADAVYWWAQSLHCQESLSQSNYGDDEGAYLYLHYVAQGCGAEECAAAFLTRVDEIRAGQIRLNSEAAGDLSGLARTIKDTKVPEVLNRLVATYITPPQESTTRADSAEVARLIRQLEKVMQEQYGMGEVRDVEAAKRLGKLGDPRAIGVLTRVAKGARVMDLGDAAQEAVDAIKKANA